MPTYVNFVRLKEKSIELTKDTGLTEHFSATDA